MALKMVKTAEETTIDPEAEDVRNAEEKPPLIPEGQYQVAFVEAGKPYWIFHQERLMLWFQIIDPGEHYGKKLYMAVRISPQKGRRSLSPSSKYARTCAVALGYSPNRTDRLSPSLFKHKYYRAVVETVKRDASQNKLPVVCQYSIIRNLLEVTAGGPKTGTSSPML